MSASLLSDVKVEEEVAASPLREATLEGVAEYLLSTARNVIVMAGAGISVAAGIPDFRSPGTGLYDNLQKYNLPSPQAVFEIGFFKENPKPFCALAKELYPGTFKPTAAHYLNVLLHQHGRLLRTYTQNIDVLERIAGLDPDKLVEAHGSFSEGHCVDCKQAYSHAFIKEKIFADEIPRCHCGAPVKPDIVFFGEALPERFHQLVADDFPKCDLLLVLGTSLQVAPFNRLIGLVPPSCPRLLLNMEKVAAPDIDPMMAVIMRLMGQPPPPSFDFDAPHSRDVFHGGDVQVSVTKLVDLLGIDWPWVSQGFVNGLGICCATPVLISCLRRKRVEPSVWRTAVAAGTFLGGYRLVRQLIDQRRRRGDSAAERLLHDYRNFVAGAVATGLGLVVDDQWLSPTLVAWWTIRALRCLLPDVPHGSTVAMCAAAAVLNPAAFLFQDEHERSYQKFMERMAIIGRHTLLHQDQPLPGPGVHGWPRQTICDELLRDLPASSAPLPHHSCTWAVLSAVAPRLFLTSLKLYAPLYLAWNCFKLRWPDRRLLHSVVTSALFLTVYSALQYWLVMLWTSTVSPTLTRGQHASFAWISGLATLIERKERRVELATYCAAHAANALCSRFARTKYFNATAARSLAWLLLVVASGTLTHFHRTHAPFVRSLFGFDRDDQQQNKIK